MLTAIAMTIVIVVLAVASAVLPPQSGEVELE